MNKTIFCYLILTSITKIDRQESYRSNFISDFVVGLTAGLKLIAETLERVSQS